MMQKIKKVWMLVILSMILSMSFASTVMAYSEDEYSEFDNGEKELLTFECDYYKKEATLVYVDSSVKNLIIPEFYDGCVVTTIGSSLHTGIYSNCVKAETIFIPSTVTTIEQNAFNGCDNLMSVTFDGNSKIQKIGMGAFSDCENLMSVKLPESVQCIDECAFIRCYSLTSINFPSSIQKIGECSFMNCKSLKNIELNDGLQVIEANAFQDCGLKTISIPASVTKIGRAAFCYCEDLTSVGGILYEIPSAIFYQCSSLADVTLADQIKAIGSEAFYGTNISSIKVPAQVSQVGNGAFQECANLKKVYFLSDPQSIAGDSFDSKSKASLYGCYGGIVEQCAKSAGLNFVGYHKVENVKAAYKNGLVKLSWDKVDGVDEYKIYRRADAIGDFEFVEITDKNSFVDLDVQREKTYYYAISVDQTLDGIEITDIRSSTASVKTPNATIEFTAKKDSGNKSVVLSWKKDSSAKNYVIYRSESKGGTYKKIGKTAKYTFTDKKIKRGKTYYYAVGIDLRASSLKKSVIKAGVKKVHIPEATVSSSKDVVEVAAGKRTSVRIKFNESGTIYVKSQNEAIAWGEWTDGWDGKYCTLYVRGVKKGTTKFVISNDYDSDTCVITVKVK